MKPTEIKELDKMKKARDLWAANVQSGKISVTNVIAEGIISEQGREEQLKDAIKTMRQLGKYREAKDLQIGRDYGVFNPSKMMDSYSENSADKKMLERELLFDSLSKATPEEAMEEIYSTRSVEPYMIPHLHILVKEHPDMKFDRFNELCDLKEPSKAYDEAGKKKTKGAWLKKISEKAGKTQENDLQNNR